MTLRQLSRLVQDMERHMSPDILVKVGVEYEDTGHYYTDVTGLASEQGFLVVTIGGQPNE